MELEKVRQMLAETKKQEKELTEELASVRQEKARLEKIQNFLLADRERKVTAGELIPLKEFGFDVLEWGSMGYGSSFPIKMEETERIIFLSSSDAARLLLEKPAKKEQVGLSPTGRLIKIGYKLADDQD